MAGSHEKLPRVFWVQIVLVLIVGLFYVFSPSPKTHVSAETTTAVKQMLAALEPIGDVEIKTEAAAPGEARAGAETVTRVCAVCHSIGLANAPKLDESAKGDWETRMAGNVDNLVQTAINGKGGMPPRGGDPSLTDEEIYLSIVDMLASSGIEVAEAGESTGVVAGAESAEAVVSVDSIVATALGESTYKASCFACHDTGAANAPVFADKLVWQPRLETGVAALHSSVINGKGAMPAKGGNPTLSDEAVIEAVNYMIANSK